MFIRMSRGGASLHHHRLTVLAIPGSMFSPRRSTTRLPGHGQQVHRQSPGSTGVMFASHPQALAASAASAVASTQLAETRVRSALR